MRLIAITAALLLMPAAVSGKPLAVHRNDRLTAHASRLHSPEQVVQIKLRDLLDLVPRKGSPGQAEVLARLKAIEDRMTALEDRIKELEQQLRTPTPLPPEPPKSLDTPARGKR